MYDRTFGTNDIANIIESVEKLSEVSSIKNFVISGGEPFADMGIAKLLLRQVRSVASGRKVYVNSNFPAENLKESIDIVNRYTNGFSISSHIIDDGYTNIDTVKKINEENLDVSLSCRVNCVLGDKDLTAGDIEKFITSHLGNNIRHINFRADYFKYPNDKIHSTNNMFLVGLKKLVHHMYDKSSIVDHVVSECAVCRTDTFVVADRGNPFEEIHISYHRSNANSTVMIGDTAMISDVIIMPDGRITLDWDGNIEVDDNGIFLMRKMLLDKMPKVVRDKSQRSSQIFSLHSCGSRSC
jgi:organic radical activating enzyme